MSNVAVVYHSGYGHTKSLAEAVVQVHRGERIVDDAMGHQPGPWPRLGRTSPVRGPTFPT